MAQNEEASDKDVLNAMEDLMSLKNFSKSMIVLGKRDQGEFKPLFSCIILMISTITVLFLQIQLVVIVRLLVVLNQLIGWNKFQ